MRSVTIGLLLPLPFLIVACTDSSSGAIDVRYALAWGRSLHRRMGGHFVFACDAYGKRLARALTPDLLQAGAVAADDGTYVIATKQGLFGYRVS